MNKGKKYKTRQRQLILNCLSSLEGKHFTVSDVLRCLNGDSASVGAATVYRHLDKLATEGKVKKFITGDNTATCFQYVDEASKDKVLYHIKCGECGKLTHLECGQIKLLADHIYKEHFITIDLLKTAIYGVCEECNKRR